MAHGGQSRTQGISLERAATLRLQLHLHKATRLGRRGFAVLYEHTRPDGSKRYVVAKGRHKDGAALSLEAATMREFIGSAHTVQPLDPQAFVHTEDGKELPGPSGNQEVLMMEYWARGSFDKILLEATKGGKENPRQTLDDHTLWTIFECRESTKSDLVGGDEGHCRLGMAITVFRAIVALRFRQRYWSDWRGLRQNEYASNPVRDEEIP